MENSKIVKVREIFFLIIFTLIIFQNPLMNLHSNFRYIDEFCFVLSVIYIIFYLCIYRKCEKIYIGMIAVMALMALVGIISNFKSDVERSIYIIVLDIVYFTKDFICFIAAGLYFRRKRVGRGFVNVFTAEIHFILLIAFVCLCISQFVDIGMTRGVRYGIPCFKFIYSNAGMWSQYGILFLFVLTADLQMNRLNYKRIFYFALLFIVWLFSCRSRAFVTAAIWLFFMVVGRKISDIRRAGDHTIRQVLRKFLKPSYIIFALCVIFLLGWEQFQGYFGEEATTARSLLFSGGLSIMKDYFPFGSGFGTFGTEIAAQYYSPLYYRYGLSSFWALTEGGSELTDCYWPAVGAEMGLFGVVLAAVLILLFFKVFIQSARGYKYFSIATITYCVYLLISSTATGIFASYITAGFLIICMAVINVDQTKRIEGA
ncbi:MAG: hypothetical protein ACLU61_00615 [Lachnospiraceae bacterium]